ncbi:MAG TPA: hypothetical protein DDY25_09150, partial [Peptococcaceae bacterium]|nr:hypothetical protein [Peptococcaceae bacterium]
NVILCSFQPNHRGGHRGSVKIAEENVGAERAAASAIVAKAILFSNVYCFTYHIRLEFDISERISAAFGIKYLEAYIIAAGV